MSTQRYFGTPHSIETLLTWVKSGEIAIPGIQQPFVWGRSRFGTSWTRSTEATRSATYRLANPSHEAQGPHSDVPCSNASPDATAWERGNSIAAPIHATTLCNSTMDRYRHNHLSF